MRNWCTSTYVTSTQGSELPSTPSFGNDDLIATLRAFPFAGLDSDLSDSERFARGVAQALRAWIKSNPDEIGSHAVFLLRPEVPESLKAKEIAAFYGLDDGETDVTRGLWFVGAPVVRGFRLVVADSFDGMFPQVVDAGLGDDIAVAFRNTQTGPILRYYPNGLADPETRVVMSLGEKPVELDKILEVVSVVHRSTLLTPSGHHGGAKLWSNPDGHFPVRHVEAEIQAYLRAGLSTGLPLCRINAEQNLVAGRLDLEIEELDPTSKTFARHAILELKVLRSFGSTGRKTSKPATERWVDEGVDQAHTYRIERNARSAALCCFDMRTNVGDKACLKKIETKAAALDVRVEAWPLYPKAKPFRADAAQSALSAGSQPDQT